mgnify:CR=1 FL=1
MMQAYIQEVLWLSPWRGGIGDLIVGIENSMVTQSSISMARFLAMAELK